MLINNIACYLAKYYGLQINDCQSILMNLKINDMKNKNEDKNVTIIK
jgi:hypothetical protein